MKEYRIYQVDAFTRERFKGNPAGVVPSAEGLTEAQMQALARELNNSETAFILPPDGADHELRIRYFTPTVEVPTCGHATVAAHYVRAIEKNLPACRVWHKIGIGTLPVDIIKEAGDYRIIMTQGDVEIADPLDAPRREAMLSALGLTSDDLDERCPVQSVSTGNSKIMVGIRRRERLNSLAPDFNALMRLSRSLLYKGVFVFTMDSDDADILTHARMFAPNIGINEDPVTGNGNGPLGAYLVHHRLAPHDGKEFYFKSRQGEAIGRPGTAHVWVEIEREEPVKVRCGGDAVIAFQTEIEI
ncbi:MAG: PhzF family isomerase [Blastocatellia bacterium]|nr:PhzF family isomerase [Blastocatellia bacterium]